MEVTKKVKLASSILVSTIGISLVRGSAELLTDARNAHIDRSILQQMNGFHVVAASFLTHNMGWYKKGVSALQPVVLYSLFEMDSAGGTTCFGGVAEDQINLVSN